MRITLALLFLTASSFAVSPSDPVYQAVKKNYPTVRLSSKMVDATVYMMTEFGRGRHSGTGTLISRDGGILTAKHLCGANPIAVTADDMEHSCTFLGATSAEDGAAFYLVKDIERLKDSCAKYIKLADNLPKIGDNVRLVGFPINRFKHQHLSVSEGPIHGGGTFHAIDPGGSGAKASYRGNQVNTSVDQGSSGGGVYNDDERIVGCTLAVGKEGQESIFCSYIDMVAVFNGLDLNIVQKYPSAGTRTVDVYTSPNCGPCITFKKDLKSGKFRGYKFRFFEGNHNYPAPTFIFNGRQHSGYRYPADLISWLKTSPSDPPQSLQPDYRPLPPQYTQPEPKPLYNPWPWGREQPPPADQTVNIDWSGVRAFVLVRKDNPRLRRFLADGAQLALNKVTGNQLHLEIIREAEQPMRFTALMAALGLAGGDWTQWPVISFGYVVDEGFVKNIIIKKIEAKIAELQFEESSEFYPDLIFRRSDPRRWESVDEALSVIDEDYVPPEPSTLGIRAIITALFAGLTHVLWGWASGAYAWFLYLLHKIGLISDRKLETKLKAHSERTAALTAKAVVGAQQPPPPPAPPAAPQPPPTPPAPVPRQVAPVMPTPPQKPAQEPTA